MQQKIEQTTTSDFFPKVPHNLEEAGLPQAMVDDLILKALYYNRQMTGMELAKLICLPYEPIIRPTLDSLRQDTLVFTTGVGNQRPNDPLFILGYAGNFRFELTENGMSRAKMAVEQCSYCGPAPVPLDTYMAASRQQSVQQVSVTRPLIKKALSHLVLPERFLDEIGPAVSSGRSVFFYGSPGNGKTAIAQAISRMIGDNVWVPYCLEVAGQTIRLLDESVHLRPAHPIEINDEADTRWTQVRRPTVLAAGEMTLESLDLAFDSSTNTYEAPLHLKANNGVFIVDDLGRQQVSPRQLLNRWIFPLEHRFDYLSLRTGRQFAVPFDVLLIFCTNLKPTDLADEAFLRRIRHKVAVPNPSEAQFREIFRRQCDRFNANYEEEFTDILLDEFYRPYGRSPRGCHPRDLLEHLADIARYNHQQVDITADSLRLAARTYFVENEPTVPPTKTGGKAASSRS